MHNLTRYPVTFIVVLALLGSSLACAVAVEGPTPPGPPIAVSTEAAGQLANLWKEAVANAVSGQVSVVITEEQLTSFLVYKLAESKDSVFSNPQVYLRDNKILIHGTAKVGDVTTTASVAFSVTVNAAGLLQLQVASANFGPVPVPADLLARLSININDGLTGSLSKLAVGVKITSVAILDGQLTIAGVLTSK